ncbi:ATP-binding protein [Streptomyces tubbatahanensis]|uniref:ATP-binding protein n=1 Tax=Streptomyces tubbatahanensis TaxID=2923272 RepID=A0ABY3XWB3_9ACTN|nr:ATP-binding protein [Streptomyces tubbatahanensis]UNS98630.1 ATP-binding protein [Streptomyces tubbatahanensis]
MTDSSDTCDAPTRTASAADVPAQAESPAPTASFAPDAPSTTPRAATADRASAPDHGAASHHGAAAPVLARVVLVTGPSGSGKTRLAARSGLPVLRLDDFYKEGDDPTLPFVKDTVDWDSPRSWDADAAVRAIAQLCREGATTAPRYDLSRSARTGTDRLALDGSPLFLAEGIFAADIAARCAALGLLADAICLRGRPSTTFRRRLLRDIREARKPLPVLLRRGWRLMRAEPALVARHRALGATPCAHTEAHARITRLRTATDLTAAVTGR